MRVTAEADTIQGPALLYIHLEHARPMGRRKEARKDARTFRAAAAAAAKQGPEALPMARTLTLLATTQEQVGRETMGQRPG